MNRGLLQSPIGAFLTSALAVTVVTATIAAVDDYVPVLGLVVLYLLPVLAVAYFYGSAWASATAIASMLAFNFFFLPPVHTLTLRDSSNWFALGVFVVTAVVVGTLAAHARRRAADAEQRERETALVADVATQLLRGPRLEGELERLASRAAEALGLSRPASELREGLAGQDRVALPARRGRGHALRPGRRGAFDQRPAASAAGARGPAGGRPRAGSAGPGGARGGDPASLGRGEDRRPARGLARPAHTAGDDRGRPRRAREPGARPERG